MKLTPRIVLQLPLGNPDALGPFVEDCLRHGVVLIAVVGENAAAVEDLIDDFVIGDGSDRSRFIVTTQHEGETLEDVMEFAATFNARSEARTALACAACIGPKTSPF